MGASVGRELLEGLFRGGIDRKKGHEAIMSKGSAREPGANDPLTGRPLPYAESANAGPWPQIALLLTCRLVTFVSPKIRGCASLLGYHGRVPLTAVPGDAK